MSDSGITKQKHWSQMIIPATGAGLIQPSQELTVITEFVGLNSVCWCTLMMAYQK